MDNTNANELIVSKLKTFRGDRGKVALDNEVTIQGDNQRIIVAKPYAPGRSTAVSGRPVFGKNDESHPPKYQTRHISSHRRLISKQFESLSTYPIDAPFSTSLAQVRKDARQVEAYSQLFSNKGVPLKVLKMDGGVVQMRTPLRRNPHRDAKLKKSEATEHHDVIANEMNAFERILDSFLRQTIQEKEFFKKFQKQRTEAIDLQTKNAFLMLRSLYGVLIGIDTNISNTNINTSFKKISHLACKLLSAEYVRITHMSSEASTFDYDENTQKSYNVGISNLPVGGHMGQASDTASSNHVEATRISKKVCTKGCIVNAFASHQESCVLANQGRKPVLGVPIITNKCVSGAIVVIGRSTSTGFTNFDVAMSKYLASLVALLLKPNGNSRHVQTNCKMDQADKIFRVFNTNEFAKELEKGETLLDLYCCIQNRFECIIHDAQSVLLFFIDPNNRHQLTIFNLKTRNIVPVASTYFFDVITDSKSVQFLSFDGDKDFIAIMAELVSFGEKIGIRVQKTCKRIAGFPCINEENDEVFAIMIATSNADLPRSQIAGASDASSRCARYICKHMESRSEKLRHTRDRGKLEDQLKATQERLKLLSNSTASACKVISSTFENDEIWKCAEVIESILLQELQADAVKLRYIRGEESNKAVELENNTKNYKMVYLSNHESFGKSHAVQEEADVRKSIVNEVVESCNIRIYDKSRQENAKLKNKFHALKNFLAVDEEWVKDNVYQLCCVPLCIGSNQRDERNDADEGKLPMNASGDNVVGVILIRACSGTSNQWDQNSIIWLQNFASIVGPWIAGRLTINRISRENKALEENIIKTKTVLKTLCGDIENGYYNPRSENLLYLAAMCSISLNTALISVYQFKRKQPSLLSRVLWLFRNPYENSSNEVQENNNQIELEELVTYPRNVKGKYKNFSLDSATIELVRQSGKMVTKAIDIIEGATTVVHACPLLKNKEIFGICVFVQEFSTATLSDKKNQVEANTFDKELFRLYTNAFSVCSNSLFSMENNHQLTSVAKNLISIWKNEHDRFNDFFNMIEFILHKLGEFFDAGDVSIFVFSKKESILWIPPMSDQPIAIPYTIPLKAIVGGHCILQKKTIVVDNMETCYFEGLDAPCHNEYIGRKPYSALMACPIIAENENVFGAIEVTNQIGSDGASSFTAEDRELLEFFALLIAPGVYQSYRKNEEDVMKLVHEGLNRIKKEAVQNEHKSGE